MRQKISMLLFIIFGLLHTSSSREIDDVILKDIIPSIGSKCYSNYASNGDKITTHTSFDHTKSPSYWNAMAAPYEDDLFLAEMSHSNDENSTQSWTLRIGQGSNMYSFIGAFGEAIPPQYQPNGIFVDEVQQSVSVNQEKNNNSGKPYFIHQAGIYSKDGEYTNEPFFSPNIAKYCSDSECSFGSWGQQAHVPTFHESDMLYFNSYRDCGGGVLELTSVFHNAASDLENGDSVSYLNAPWGGVRRSVLRDLLISDQDKVLKHKYPMPSFFDNDIPDMKDTGGFTTFTEQIQATDEDFAKNSFSMPIVDGQTLELVVASGLTTIDTVKSEQWNRTCFRTNIEETVIVKSGCPFCTLYFTNPEGYRFYVPVVIHWAWEGKYIYYCSPLRDPTDRDKKDDATEFKLNQQLPKGTKITVTLANEGKPKEENMALTYVHGLETSLGWASSRLRFGWAGGARRDYSVYTSNIRLYIDPGDTYVYQQYIITGKLDQMESTASSWVGEVFQEKYALGEMDGTSIHLYSSGEDIFGAHAEGDSTNCLQGVSRCVGKSVPTYGMTPLFAVSCGSKHYVGPDRYHFSPPRTSETETIRSYACEGEAPGVRPEWKLLGFFAEDACNFLTNAIYDASFCSTSLSPTSLPSMSPSNQLSLSPSIIPSNFKSLPPSINSSPSPSTELSPNPTLASSTIPSMSPSLDAGISTSPTIAPTKDKKNKKCRGWRCYFDSIWEFLSWLFRNRYN